MTKIVLFLDWKSMVRCGFEPLMLTHHWKFVEEFLQNADDCDYESTPEIAITVDERDKGRPIVEFEYNENGFTREDVWALRNAV